MEICGDGGGERKKEMTLEQAAKKIVEEMGEVNI